MGDGVAPSIPRDVVVSHPHSGQPVVGLPLYCASTYTCGNIDEVSDGCISGVGGLIVTMVCIS